MENVDEKKYQEYKAILKSERKPHEIYPVQELGYTYLYGGFSWKTTLEIFIDKFVYYIQTPVFYALVTQYLNEYKWRVLCGSGIIVFRSHTEKEAKEFLEKMRIRYDHYKLHKEAIKPLVISYEKDQKKIEKSIYRNQNQIRKKRDDFKLRILLHSLQDNGSKEFLRYRISKSVKFCNIMLSMANLQVDNSYTDPTGMDCYNKLASQNITVSQYIDLFRSARAMYLDLQPPIQRRETRSNWEATRLENRESRLKKTPQLELILDDYQGFSQEFPNIEISKHQYEYTDDSSSDEEIEF